MHKVTIVPRGRALGVTQQLPTEDRYTMTRDYTLGRIAVLMGGRAAEEVIYDEITSGAGNDIEVATDLARKMVCEWGMSSLIGPLRYAGGNTNPFLGGGSGASARPYSEDVAQKIDAELREIITTQYDNAVTLLNENRELLEAMTSALLEFESIDAEDIELLLEDVHVDRVRERHERMAAEEAAEEAERTPKTGFSSKLKELGDLGPNPALDGPAF